MSEKLPKTIRSPFNPDFENNTTIRKHTPLPNKNEPDPKDPGQRGKPIEEPKK